MEMQLVRMILMVPLQKVVIMVEGGETSLAVRESVDAAGLSCWCWCPGEVLCNVNTKELQVVTSG